MGSPLSFIAFFVGGMAFLAFLNPYLPVSYRFFEPLDMLWLAGSVIGVSAACVVITGLACPVALGIFGAVNVYKYLIVSNSTIQLLVFTPLVLILIYQVSQMARGSG
jgi:hypothetical protein